MTKSYSIYIGSLLIFGIGLWLVLSFGAIYARATTDIAGEWKTEKGETIRVEQSGQFFEITLVDGRRMSLVLQSESKDQTGRVTMILAGAKGSVQIRGESVLDVCEFEIGESDRVTYAVRRTSPQKKTTGKSSGTKNGH